MHKRYIESGDLSYYKEHYYTIVNGDGDYLSDNSSVLRLVFTGDIDESVKFSSITTAGYVAKESSRNTGRKDLRVVEVETFTTKTFYDLNGCRI